MNDGTSLAPIGNFKAEEANNKHASGRASEGHLMHQLSLNNGSTVTRTIRPERLVSILAFAPIPVSNSDNAFDLSRIRSDSEDR